MSGVWRCRVCEGVNQGGRTCSTCGAVVARGEPLRAAVKMRAPSTTRPTAPAPPPPVPATPRRRDLRELPTPEELLLTDPFELFRDGGRIHVVPGGCLMPMAPRRRRRRRMRWY